MDTANSFSECDRMFIPDFLKLDELVAKSQKEKRDNLRFFVENLMNMV